jgi:hypothetical protein
MPVSDENTIESTRMRSLRLCARAQFVVADDARRVAAT